MEQSHFSMLLKFILFYNSCFHICVEIGIYLKCTRWQLQNEVRFVFFFLFLLILCANKKATTLTIFLRVHPPPPNRLSLSHMHLIKTVQPYHTSKNIHVIMYLSFWQNYNNVLGNTSELIIQEHIQYYHSANIACVLKAIWF